MKKELEKTYRGFLGWIRYIRDYKDNIENDLVSQHRLIEANTKINKLEKEIKTNKDVEKALNEIITKQDNRIHLLNEKISLIKKENNEILTVSINSNNDYIEAIKKIEELKTKLSEKEHSRRMSAGAVGGLKAKINELKKELDKANYTINFYKTHQKSPNIEELKAYEFQQKEVEKRIKKK